MALSVTYTGSQSVSWGTPLTPKFNAVPVGTAVATRMVLVIMCISYANGPVGDTNALQVTDVLINGVSVGSNFIIADSAVSWRGQYIYAWAAIPTGTTVTADFTSSRSPAGFGTQYVMAYTFDSTQAAAAPTHAETTTAGATSLANSINTTTGGFLISAANSWHLTSQTSFSITSSDETFTTDITNAGATTPFGMGHVNNVATRTPSNVTWTWVGSSQAGFASMLFWAASAAAPSGFTIALV